MRKDKEKVVDEVWTEDHVKSYLNVRSYDGTAEDFHMLLKAYQSMKSEDFELFVGLFCAEGRNLNAFGKDGRTVLDVISSHRHGVEYAEILKAAGAG
ncbi:MAG: PA4642 family protein [Halioglobus sp.]